MTKEGKRGKQGKLWESLEIPDVPNVVKYGRRDKSERQKSRRDDGLRDNPEEAGKKAAARYNKKLSGRFDKKPIDKPEQDEFEQDESEQTKPERDKPVKEVSERERRKIKDFLTDYDPPSYCVSPDGIFNRFGVRIGIRKGASAKFPYRRPSWNKGGM